MLKIFIKFKKKSEWSKNLFRSYKHFSGSVVKSTPSLGRNRVKPSGQTISSSSYVRKKPNALILSFFKKNFNGSETVLQKESKIFLKCLISELTHSFFLTNRISFLCSKTNREDCFDVIINLYDITKSLYFWAFSHVQLSILCQIISWTKNRVYTSTTYLCFLFKNKGVNKRRN